MGIAVRQPLLIEQVENRIFIIRGHKVMLSTHLAELYGVEPKVLIQAVKRNIERFPQDFMFQLKDEEFKNLKSQFVTSSWGGLRRAIPYAFTEQGVAMLSSVLRSRREELPQTVSLSVKRIGKNRNGSPQKLPFLETLLFFSFIYA